MANPGEYEVRLRMVIQSNDEFAQLMERLRTHFPRAAIAIVMDLITGAEDVEFTVREVVP